MRWQAPSERTQMWLAAPVVVPIAVLCLPIIGAMVVGIKVAEWVFPAHEWRPWFAWRPVRIVDWDALRGEWFWFEMIERKRPLAGEGCQYRAASAMSAFGQDPKGLEAKPASATAKPGRPNSIGSEQAK